MIATIIPDRVRILGAASVVLASATAIYAMMGSPPVRMSVGVYVLNRSGMELRDVRLEFDGTALAPPKPAAQVRMTEEYGYSTETSEPIPSKVAISFVTPDGARRSYEGLDPRRVVGRDEFLEGHDMRIEVQPLLGVDVLFSRRGKAEPGVGADSR